MKNSQKKKVVDMSLKERWAEHYRHIVKKMGFYLRKQVRKKGASDYSEELKVLGEQASQLKFKIQQASLLELGQDAR